MSNSTVGIKVSLDNEKKPLSPFVSVIIPVYNDDQRLQLCLRALDDQTYPRQRYEVIVVDNGSDNDIQPIVDQFERVTLARELRRGSYAARNTGLSLAKGEIIAFTDSDCIPARDWLEKGVARLQAEPHTGLVAGSINVFFKDQERPTPVELYESIRAFPQQKFVNLEHYGATANVFTYRHVFDKVGTFNETLKSSGDRDWGRRVYAAGYPLVYADEVRISHPARYSFDEMYLKSLRVVGGFRDFYSRKKFVKGLIRDMLPPVKDVIEIVRDDRLVNVIQKAQVLYVLLRLRYSRVWLRLKVLFGYSIGLGR